MIDNIIDYINTNDLNLPSLEGKTFEEIMNSIVNNKETFSQLLCLLTVLVDNKFIRIPNELAKQSIKYKIEKKAYLLNIILDILKYLDMIEYIKVSEDLILAKIINEELANSLSNMKRELIAKNNKANNLINELDKELSNNKEYLRFKEQFNGKDNTTISK